MRRKDRKKTFVYLLIILLVSIGIGYAFLNQDLTINGTGKVTANNWSIYFDNIVFNSGNVALSTGDSAAAINSTTLTDVTYTITLQKPGDVYEFTVDVVNDGSLDAMVSTVSNKLGGVEIDATHPLPNYLNYSVTYDDGVAIAPNHLLEAGDTETYKVRLEYKTDITANDLPTANQTLTINFSVEYVQADDNAIAKPVFILPNGRNANNLQVGDELCLPGATTECFNFLHYDNSNEDAVLLAKYNLKVGGDFSCNQIACSSGLLYHTDDINYGLQDSTMRGAIAGESIRKGVVAFSYTNYWVEGTWPNDILKAKYGSSYPANVYDDDYVTAPDFSTVCDGSSNCWSTSGYSIAYYVEQYKNTLMGTGYGANIKYARLLTYEEVIDSNIGCIPGYVSQGNGCPESFITTTAYFLESVEDSDNIWYIGERSLSYISRANNFTFGVRPVIVVAKSNL